VFVKSHAGLSSVHNVFVTHCWFGLTGFPHFDDATIEDLDHEEIQHTIKIAVNVNRIDADALT